MSILTDFHTHSYFSGDCNTPTEDMIQKAISLGMTHLCLTEHLDLDYPSREQLDFNLNIDAYLSKVSMLKEKYQQQIQILWGVELGIQSHIIPTLHDYVQKYPFDFIIGSSHLAHGKDPYYLDFYEERTEEEAYREYFTSILENVQEFTDYDVYGHLDYVVRYGPNKDTRYSYEKYRDILDKILETILSKGKGIELNTGGLKSGLKDVHPCTDILKQYKKLGGEIITIGSDAHVPQYLTHHFDRAEEVLKNCGFEYYTIFKNRKPSFIKL